MLKMIRSRHADAAQCDSQRYCIRFPWQSHVHSSLFVVTIFADQDFLGNFQQHQRHVRNKNFIYGSLLHPQNGFVAKPWKGCPAESRPRDAT